MSDTAATAEILSKTEFATRIGVSKGRVSQYIKSGQISGAALVTVDDREMINVPVALAQLAENLNAGQLLGNGAETDLSNPAQAAIQPAAPRPPSVTDQYQMARLEAQQMANRRAQEQEAERKGIYVLAADVSAEMNRLAARMMAEFEGAIPEMATALAAKFKLPNRDVMHEIRAAFRSARQGIADKLELEAAAEPEFAEVEGDDDPVKPAPPVREIPGDNLDATAAG